MIDVDSVTIKRPVSWYWVTSLAFSLDKKNLTS
ncbi:hypothetical protein GASC598P17_000020, partial [Gilliamella apis SCGC AB-598-P17]